MTSPFVMVIFVLVSRMFEGNIFLLLLGQREMTEELRRAPHARAPPISVLSQHRAMQTAATPRADTVVSCGGPRVSAAARAFCGNCRNVIVVRRYGPISPPSAT